MKAIILNKMNSSSLTKKLALFDFCGTIVKIQTANNFVKYVLYKINSSIIRKISFHVISFLIPIGFLRKKMLLFLLRGTSKNMIDKLGEEYVLEILNTKINDLVYNKIVEYKKNNYLTVIISGGYAPYLKAFAEIHNIDYIIGTDLEYNKENIFTGFIQGLDCMGLNKVMKLKQSFNIESLDLYNSCLYSDSMTDKYLFDLVGNKFLVVNKMNSCKIEKIN